MWFFVGGGSFSLGFFSPTCFSSNIEDTFGTSELGIADGWLEYSAGLCAACNSLSSFARLQKHCIGNT